MTVILFDKKSFIILFSFMNWLLVNGETDNNIFSLYEKCDSVWIVIQERNSKQCEIGDHLICPNLISKCKQKW